MEQSAGQRNLRAEVTLSGIMFSDADERLEVSTFRQHLKTFLFQASFPDIVIDPR